MQFFSIEGIVENVILVASFFQDFIYLFVERGEGREKERERSMDVQERNIDRLLLACPPTGDLAYNPRDVP